MRDGPAQFVVGCAKVHLEVADRGNERLPLRFVHEVVERKHVLIGGQRAAGFHNFVVGLNRFENFDHHFRRREQPRSLALQRRRIHVNERQRVAYQLLHVQQHGGVHDHIVRTSRTGLTKVFRSGAKGQLVRENFQPAVKNRLPCNEAVGHLGCPLVQNRVYRQISGLKTFGRAGFRQRQLIHRILEGCPLPAFIRLGGFQCVMQLA